MTNQILELHLIYRSSANALSLDKAKILSSEKKVKYFEMYIRFLTWSSGCGSALGLAEAH